MNITEIQAVIDRHADELAPVTHERTPPFCCIIDCSEPAYVEIINVTPGANPYDATHACEAHVGALLGSNNDVEGRMWHVQIIEVPT